MTDAQAENTSYAHDVNAYYRKVAEEMQSAKATHATKPSVRTAGRKTPKPTHVSITNHTSARVAVSLNAASSY